MTRPIPGAALRGQTLPLYQAQTVTPLQRKSIETVIPLFYIKVFYCTVPVRGSLLHGHVTAISKRDRYPQKPSGNRYNGTYGLQVWKVAQLVERWTFNLHVPGSIPGFPILLCGDHPKIFSQTPCRNMGCFVFRKRKLNF